jgi:hypothetical protein
MYAGYGVGSVFDVMNDFLNTISLLLYCVFKYIYSYLSEIDYNAIAFDIITTYSTMKENIVTVYRKNIDKDSPINISLEYMCYCIEYLKSFVLNYRIEPFNNNWVSISYIDQSEYDKNTLSFTFDETYDEIDNIYFFKDSFEYDNDYTGNFKEWYNTAKIILLKDKKVYDCLISMRMNDTYIYKVCDMDSNSFDKLPCEPSKVKFLSIDYIHPEVKNPIPIHIDNSAYLVGNEILSCTFVKRALEYSFNVKNFDADYELRIMDNDLNVIRLKSNEYIVLEKNTYKIIQKNSDDYVILDDEIKQDGNDENYNIVESQNRTENDTEAEGQDATN